MKSVPNELIGLLGQEMTPLEGKLFSDQLNGMASDFIAYAAQADVSPNLEEKDILALQLMEFLIHRINHELEGITRLQGWQEEFNQRFSRAVTEKERRDHIIEFARILGASGRGLRGDRRAFGRWFGHDTVIERCSRRISESEYRLVFLLGRLGILASIAFGHDSDLDAQANIWRRLDLEKLIRPLLVFKGDHRVRIEAFRCLARAVAVLDPQVKESSLEESTLAFIYRSSLDTRQDIWIQCEALSLLAVLDPPSLARALERRLDEPGPGDDLFVRRWSVGLLRDRLTAMPELDALILKVFSDPSPFVRQALTSAVTAAIRGNSSAARQKDAGDWLSRLLLEDPSPQVRAAAALEASGLVIHVHLVDYVSELFLKLFSREEESFVLRTGLKAVTDSLALLVDRGLPDEAGRFYDLLLPAVERLHLEAADLSVRRWAAMSRERMFTITDVRARELNARLEKALTGLPPGRSLRLPRRLFKGFDEMTLGRVLSVMSQEDFNLCLEKKIFGMRLTRGDVFGFRLWRLVHELFSPSPDKRQGFSHIIGRIYRGRLMAPSAVLSELTQTKVPGEPLYMDSESGWRPYLPLPDAAISIMSDALSNRPSRLFTSEGVTEIRPPRSILRRIAGLVALTLGFAHYARLRNWDEHGRHGPETYVRALTRLGLRIRFKGFEGRTGVAAEDPSVTRFFPLTLPFLNADLWSNFKDYFFSAYENSLYELGLFAGVLLALFVGHRLYSSLAVRRARHRIPLVIGGWGTRGKSGVERLKSAIFEALGHGLVNKTTGSEAMFLHAFPYGKTREMFLFRSYDKATIWEHHDMTLMAERLKTKVFLWECMGLNPGFVEILQRHWAHDDYSTITNTYPDHEDIQGPAGFNITEVMTRFIPRKGTLITSEEVMKPILSAGAKEKVSRIKSIGWLEAGLLPPDVMERFPYREHPYNVALVLALAEELGIDRDFALKEMADRVIPDIGVLKTFPKAAVNGRRLEFVNGMAANERYAALSNWARTDFESQSRQETPDLMLSAVVNNRADRISRSRMFASILVEDLRADRFFLIGSNLAGLKGYINAAWGKFIESFSLWTGDGPAHETPEEIFTALAVRLRIPTSDDQVKRRLEAMLGGLEGDFDRADLVALWADPPALKERLAEMGQERFAEEISAHIRDQLDRLNEFKQFLKMLQDQPVDDRKGLDAEFRRLAGRWFKAKLVIIEDVHVSGNQIIDRICRETPPGLMNRIMGIQNIKGPGLDFVYCWQAWDACHQACRMLRSDGPPEEVEQGLAQLSAFHEYGVLSEEFVRETLSVIQDKPISQTEKFQAELSLIQSNLEQGMAEVRKEISLVRKTGVASNFLEWFEAFLDAGDAVRRRKKANRIYKDLINERISHARAAIELKNLNKRQKGGWLSERLK